MKKNQVNKEILMLSGLVVSFIVITCFFYHFILGAVIEGWFPYGVGSIGSEIGGVATLLLGSFNLCFLAVTIAEQLKFNKQQRRIAFEEQFKSAFFSLLQVQRNIAESIEGEFFFFNGRVDNIVCNSTKGNHFFISSKNQLSWLFYSITQCPYRRDYTAENAFELEEYLENEISYYHDDEQDSFLENHRRPFRTAFYNNKYSISENAHELFKQSDDKKKIAIVYAHFYNKQPGLRHYFKHLLAILRYVKESEDECVSFKTDKEEIATIRSQFKNQAQFIVSQMMNDEVVIVFYHAFLDNEFRELIIKYDLLKDLVVEDVLFGHNCLEGYTLKSRKTELNEMLGTI